MKTYDQMIQIIAENSFHDEMGGGHGQIDVGLVDVIYDVPRDKVYSAAKIAKDLMFKKHYNKSLTQDQLEDFWAEVNPETLESGQYYRARHDFEVKMKEYETYVVIDIIFTYYDNVIEAVGHKVEGDNGLEELEYNSYIIKG